MSRLRTFAVVLTTTAVAATASGSASTTARVDRGNSDLDPVVRPAVQVGRYDRLRPSPDATVTSSRLLEMPEPTQVFDGISNPDRTALPLAPPDPNGDVGPTQYVQTTNGPESALFRVFAKDGSPLTKTRKVSSLWKDVGGPCAESGQGDPIVQYDALAERWLFTQFAFIYGDLGPAGPFYQCVAISDSSDALSPGTAYTFLIHNRFFPDFPKLGVWPDAYYLSVHLFTRKGVYKGQGLIALDRETMLAGGEAREIQSFLKPSQFGALPSDVVDLFPHRSALPTTSSRSRTTTSARPRTGCRSTRCTSTGTSRRTRHSRPPQRCRLRHSARSSARATASASRRRTWR